jgi:hypothetical protein
VGQRVEASVDFTASATDPTAVTLTLNAIAGENSCQAGDGESGDGQGGSGGDDLLGDTPGDQGPTDGSGDQGGDSQGDDACEGD